MAEEQPCQEYGLRKKEKDGQEHSNLVKYNRHCGFEALYIQKDAILSSKTSQPNWEIEICTNNYNGHCNYTAHYPAVK